MRTEQGKGGACAWCGNPTDGQTIGELPACSDCVISDAAEQRKDRWSPLDKKPVPPQRRFEELFQAARVLLKEGVGEEDQVFPTLAFANGIGEGFVDLIAAKERLIAAQGGSDGKWDAESDKFVRGCPTYRPVRIVEGVLILERLPVSVEIYNYPHPEIVMPKMVTIEVKPSARVPKPEHVANLYKSVLAANDLSCTETSLGTLHFTLARYPTGNVLHIDVKHPLADEADIETQATLYPEGKPNFLHPSFIRDFYNMLLALPAGDEFARYLAARGRGRGPDADALIPACVAAYLRRLGGIRSRKEAHQLLNQHVLRGTWKALLPEEGYSSSAVSQLWRDVEKVQPWTLHADLGLFC